MLEFALWVLLQSIFLLKGHGGKDPHWLSCGDWTLILTFFPFAKIFHAFHTARSKPSFGVMLEIVTDTIRICLGRNGCWATVSSGQDRKFLEPCSLSQNVLQVSSICSSTAQVGLKPDSDQRYLTDKLLRSSSDVMSTHEHPLTTQSRVLCQNVPQVSST